MPTVEVLGNPVMHNGSTYAKGERFEMIKPESAIKRGLVKRVGEPRKPAAPATATPKPASKKWRAGK